MYIYNFVCCFVVETAVSVLTNIPPLGGTCSMSTTSSAKAFASLFVVSCDNWNVAYVNEARHWYESLASGPSLEYSVWIVSAETSRNCVLSQATFSQNATLSSEALLSTCRAFKVAGWTYNNSLSFVLGVGRYYVYAQIRDVYTHAISVSLLSNVILVTLPSSADHLYVSASQMRYHYFAQRQINEYMSAMTAVMYSLFNNANGFEQVFNMSELPTQARLMQMRVGEPDSSTLDVTKVQMIIDALTNALQLYSSQLSKYENARIDHVQGIIDTVSILLQQCVNGQKVDPQNSQYVHLISTVYSLLQSCGLHAFVDANPLECVQFDFL
ncbi:hypothetical protein RFI_32032, partial [Reticulomyxa filosa]